MCMYMYMYRHCITLRASSSGSLTQVRLQRPLWFMHSQGTRLFPPQASVWLCVHVFVLQKKQYGQSKLYFCLSIYRLDCLFSILAKPLKREMLSCYFLQTPLFHLTIRMFVYLYLYLIFRDTAANTQMKQLTRITKKEKLTEIQNTKQPRRITQKKQCFCRGVLQTEWDTCK